MLHSRKPLEDEPSVESSEGHKTVFVSGNFNVVHPGHLRLLQFAASCGDRLVVGVNGDGAPGVTVPADLRVESIRAISFVDEAHLLEDEPSAFIARLRPAVVVKGKEYEDGYNPEREVVERYGGRLLFGAGEMRFSSLDLLRREYVETDYATIRKPTEYPKRHGFVPADLTHVLARLKGLKVVVIGDLMVDEYIDCEPIGMSQEDPTLVVTPLNSEKFVGGGGIVAGHARGLKGHVTYVGIAGMDANGLFAERTLAAQGTNAVLVRDESRPTILKQRFRALNKTLLRVSHLRQHDISSEIAAKVMDAVKAHGNDADLILFSDFNYGCLPQGLVRQITAFARRRDIMMAADSQASSQLGDICRFQRMALVTPTEREARLALHEQQAGLAVLIEAVRRKAMADHVLLTLGSEGLLVNTTVDGTSVTDQLPAFNTAAKDPAGGGDSLFACTAMALCAGADIWRGTYLGSIAAACQVGRIGNVPLTHADVKTEIERSP